MLTHEEFLTKTSIYWLNVSKAYKWSSIKVDLLHLWLNKNTTTWWYSKNEFFCFGSKEDLELTLTFIKLGSFDKDQGEI